MSAWTEQYQYERLTRMQERMDSHREMYVRDLARDAHQRGDSRIIFPVRTNRGALTRGFVPEGGTLPTASTSRYATIEVVAIQPLFSDENGLLIIESMIRHAYDEAVPR